jgi:hypothetical protein
MRSLPIRADRASRRGAGNILIQAGHALVADFGVAVALDAATVGAAPLAGEIMGTPIYERNGRAPAARWPE